MLCCWPKPCANSSNSPKRLQVAEHGLELEGYQSALAIWVRDLAESLGYRDRALAAAVIAVQEAPDLNAYLKVKALAGEYWPQQRTALLKQLRSSEAYGAQGRVDIFLHEGLIDYAIAAVRYASYDLLAQVMDAAIAERPDWVIDTACRQAESIANAGKAKYYDHVATWLSKAKAAYQSVDREQEWQDYLDKLRTEHRRKYKLMDMLRNL